MKALVIGGGIFGVTAAIELAKSGIETDLFERDSRLMQGATSVNQNRFHLGYHYPRSLAIAKQCLEGIGSFKEYFGSALTNTEENYYAIGKRGSRVSFNRYLDFCNELKLPYEENFPNISLLNRNRVAGCIRVDEQIINLVKLKNIGEKLIKKYKVNVFLKREFKGDDGDEYNIIVNASYNNFNKVNKLLGLPVRKFRYDVCNVPIVKLPKKLSGIGITIMDGPFYSILPYAGTPYHLFWSVKGSAKRSISTYPPKEGSKKIANYRDARYIPLLKQAKLIDVLRVTKILRPDIELSDERVTDLIDYGNGKFAILSAKINTCVLAARKLAMTVNAQNKITRN